MVFSRNKKTYTPVNPSLLYKSGVWGGQNYIGMFSWCFSFLLLLESCASWLWHFLCIFTCNFMLSFSNEYHANIIETFNSTSRYLDDLLNINNEYFEQMVDTIYPKELQFNKSNKSIRSGVILCFFFFFFFFFFVCFFISKANDIIVFTINVKRYDFHTDSINVTC